MCGKSCPVTCNDFQQEKKKRIRNPKLNRFVSYFYFIFPSGKKCTALSGGRGFERSSWRLQKLGEGKKGIRIHSISQRLLLNNMTVVNSRTPLAPLRTPPPTPLAHTRPCVGLSPCSPTLGQKGQTLNGTQNINKSGRNQAAALDVNEMDVR